MVFETPRWFWSVFFFTAILFFLGTAFLSWNSAGEIFVSPDETANAFFANQFAQTGRLTVFEPLNQAVNDVLHPRSTLSKNGLLVPAGFLGLPVLYGIFVFFFGKWVLFVLTPLIAIFAALSFRQILLRIFSPLVSHICAILFLFHPALWYYSARGLMPNVLFTCLIIFSVYFLFCRPIQKERFFSLNPILSGVFLGLALFVRASEVYWIIPLFAVLLFFSKQRSWKNVFSFLGGTIIGLIPFFLFNFFTYGGFFLTGYTLPTVSSSSASATVSSSLSLFFPLGFSLRSAVKHILAYGFYLFSLLTLFSVVGLSRVIKTLSKNDLRPAYLLILFFLSIWLGVWYGSWTIFDNPDPIQITIANSYVRYWLPIYLLCLPLIAEAIVWMSLWTKKGFLQILTCFFLSLVLFAQSIWIVFFAGQDSLVRTVHTLAENRQTRSAIFSSTPANSLYIVDRADKLFFPYRRVLYPLRSEQTYALMPALTKVAPLYYYGITFPESDLTYLNTEKLKPLGLQIEFVKTYGVESLYHIYAP